MEWCTLLHLLVTNANIEADERSNRKILKGKKDPKNMYKYAEPGILHKRSISEIGETTDHGLMTLFVQEV